MTRKPYPPPPPIPLEIVEFLERAFRNNIPSTALPHSDMCVLVGEQNVVRRMRALFNKQQDNILES